VGDPVVMMGIGEMEFTGNDHPVEFGKIKRRLVVRVGRIESVCPEGDHMIKAPCVQTSIPVFPGMSGGAVTRWNAPKTPIQPFGLISHSPSADTYYDCSVSGSSTGAILTTKVETIAGGRRQFRITMKNTGIGRSDLHPGRRTRQEHGSMSMETSRELESNLMLQHALFCDDVRMEQGGKSILIGVYDQQIMVTDFPASISICLWARFKINVMGIYVTEFNVIGERGQQFVSPARTELDVRDISKCQDVTFRAANLSLTEPQMLRFQWRVQGDEWKEASSIRIIAQPTSVSVNVSQPPAETS
jgi:hypothetical protein